MNDDIYYYGSIDDDNSTLDSLTKGSNVDNAECLASVVKDLRGLARRDLAKASMQIPDRLMVVMISEINRNIHCKNNIKGEKKMLLKLLGTKAAMAGVSAIVMTGTAAAAATGSLPGPVQNLMSLTAASVGISIPASTPSSKPVLSSPIQAPVTTVAPPTTQAPVTTVAPPTTFAPVVTVPPTPIVTTPPTTVCSLTSGAVTASEQEQNGCSTTTTATDTTSVSGDSNTGSNTTSTDGSGSQTSTSTDSSSATSSDSSTSTTLASTSTDQSSSSSTTVPSQDN